MDIKDANTLRHAENIAPILRGITTTQRHVTAAECSRVLHRIVNGKPVTWGVIEGGKREVWR